MKKFIRKRNVLELIVLPIEILIWVPILAWRLLKFTAEILFKSIGAILDGI